MNIRSFLAVTAIVFFSSFSTASAQQSPDEFVISLMEDAKGLSNLSEDTREQALLNLVRRGFDISTVGKFVLGRYWRRATYKQKQEFLDVFEKAAVRSFSPILKDIPLDTFNIVRVEYRDVNDISVFSTIEVKKGKTIKIRWRLRLTLSPNAYRIIDITAEGVSLVVTFRSEYGSVIRRQGGIDGLIAILRARVEKSKEITEK